MDKSINPVHFTSLTTLLKSLPTDEACREYLETKIWPDGIPTCPYCGSQKAYKLKSGNVFKGTYKCSGIGCKKRFNCFYGTMFEHSHIPLRQWFIAIYMHSLHKKGISSHQLATDLGITQKSAWYMLHRIRLAFGIDDSALMGGEGVIVELDETIHGGKVKNMSKAKRAAIAEGEAKWTDNKTNIMGTIERGGNLRLQVMQPDVPAKEYVAGGVDKDSILCTDAAARFNKVGRHFAKHAVVDHSKDEYVKDKIWHTNTLEGAFGLFDRMIIGIYHNVSPKHLQAYCNEHEFRYNNRKQSVNDRFDFSLRNSRRLPYSVLIAD